MEAPIYLSCSLSPIENLRRMAEHNAQGTQAGEELRNEIINYRFEETRVRCIAAMVGLIGLGILLAFTTSTLIGGIVALSANIPRGIAYSEAARVNVLTTRFTNEGETNLKFIYDEIRTLFREVMKQQIIELAELWNNDQSIDLTSKEELTSDSVRRHAFSALVELQQDYQHKYSYAMTFDHQTVQISYANLKRYAAVIAATMPKESNGITSIWTNQDWIQKLQEIAARFIEVPDESSVDFDEETIRLEEDMKINDSFKNKKMQNARKFIYRCEDTGSDGDDVPEKKLAAFLMVKPLIIDNLFSV